MTMQNMVYYLETRGFEVEKKYNSLMRWYEFKIRKDGYGACSNFKYRVDNDPTNKTLHRRQKRFLDDLIELYEKNIEKEDKNMLDAIEDIKPCLCGGRPIISHTNFTDGTYPKVLIECDCGRKIETDYCSISDTVAKWNIYSTGPWINSVYGTTTTHPGFMFSNYGRTRIDPFEIERVIFNDPATIVFWKDGTKTVVKATDEPFDEEKGLAMAITKKVYGNKGNYFNKIKKFLISRYVNESNNDPDWEDK